MLTVAPLALSFSPKYFHDPEIWHPERWLPSAENDLDSPFHHDHGKAVRAFGWGPHICVGEPLGWAQMRLMLARMVWEFDIRDAGTENSRIEWGNQEVFAVIDKHRLDVTIADRKV
jgi:cytochrome P450